MRAVGTVNIVHLGESLCGIDGCNKLLGQLALAVDEVLYLLLALFNISQIGELLLKVTEHRIVKASRNLLTVTGNEGDSVSLVNKCHGLCNLILLKTKLLREF